MESIDVLLGRDPANHRLRVDLFRQRHLHENAMDRGIRVQPIDHGEQFCLRGCGRHADRFAMHARFFARFLFRADVHRTRRVFAHEHDRQSRNDSTFREYGGRNRHLRTHFVRDGRAVDDFSGQCPSLSFRGSQQL